MAISTIAELLALRQFKTEDDLAAALLPGVEFYQTIGMQGEPTEVGYKRHVVGTIETSGTRRFLVAHVHIDDSDEIKPYDRKEYLHALQNWPSKSVFLKRADAEHYLAVAQSLYDRMPSNAGWLSGQRG